MDRLEFRLRMYHLAKTGAKCETRRGPDSKAYKKDGVYMLAVPHSRPEKEPLNPFHYQAFHQWINTWAKHFSDTKSGPKEEGQEFPVDWKPCGAMLMPSWACAYGAIVSDVFMESGSRIDQMAAVREGFDTLAEFEDYLGQLRPNFRQEMLKVVRFKVYSIQQLAEDGKLDGLITKDSGWPESWPERWEDELPDYLVKAIKEGSRG